jgi:amidase
MNDIVAQPAKTLVGLMKARKLSPVEVTEAYLRRIEQLNPRLNAIVTLAADAMDQAKIAEVDFLRNDRPPVLRGLPVTIKDTIETSGLRSTSGSMARAEFIPQRDAPAIARLKAAGAIILGKTNAAEMAMDYTADNPLFGRTNNPHDLSRCPGGSSGGEAAAIATCMSACGLGSDLAGSIRIPAHFCGIAGLKPGSTQIPSAGQFPPCIGPYSLGAAIGPMARNVEDLQLLYQVLAGSELYNMDLHQVIAELRGCRVAWYTDDCIATVTEETRKAVVLAARALSAGGLKVEEVLPPAIKHGHRLWLSLFSRASVVQLREVYTGVEENIGGFVRWRLATADDKPSPTLDEYIKGWMKRDRLRAELIDWMEEVPLLIAPVGAVPATRHDDTKVTVGDQTMNVFRAFSYSQTSNVFDLPSVTVPVFRSSEGLPIGVQIIGRPDSEDSVLAAAMIVQNGLGGWQAPAICCTVKL